MSTPQPHPDPLPHDAEPGLRHLDDRLWAFGEAARRRAPADLADRVFFRSAGLLVAHTAPARPMAGRLARHRSVAGRFLAAACLGLAFLAVLWIVRPPAGPPAGLPDVVLEDSVDLADIAELNRALVDLSDDGREYLRIADDLARYRLVDSTRLDDLGFPTDG